MVETEVVSRYIMNPHLIEGYKYDLRLYVIVTSYDPLRIYLYEEGLVRFATEKYTTAKDDLDNLFIHLTNFSINKDSESYVENTKAKQDGYGSKWSLRALRRKFVQLGINYDETFRKIEDLITKTIMTFQNDMNSYGGS